MKKFKVIQLVGIALLIISATSYLVANIISNQYDPDVKTAIKNESIFKNPIEISTISCKEGLVCFALINETAICSYSFYTKNVNGIILYKVAEKRILPYNGSNLSYTEQGMIKMNTSPNSIEQIAFGVGANLQNECTAKTNIEAKHINFVNNGIQHSMWYIISPNGLDELPDLILNNSAFYNTPSMAHYLAGSVFAGTIVIAIIIICLKKRKDRKALLSTMIE